MFAPDQPTFPPSGGIEGGKDLLLLTLILLLAFFFRTASLTTDRFHADEALYSGWALRILDGDPFLLDVPVDKPPLYLFTLAASFRVFGNSELAARLPNLAASMLNLALVYALARRLYNRRAARWATFFLACSPYSVLFARTAFTDTTLVTWALAALYAAAGKHWLRAGIAMGLALATKQHAVILYPLVFAVGWASKSPKSAPFAAEKSERQCLLTTLSLLGFAPIFALITWWDAQRWEIRPGYWQQSTLSYGGLAWAVPATWGERLLEWLGWGRFLFGSPLLYAAFGLGIVLLLLWDGDRLPSRTSDVANTANETSHRSDRRLRTRTALNHSRHRMSEKWLDALLIAYLLAYILLHTVAGFSVWDRYLLPLAPLVALLVGRIAVVGADPGVRPDRWVSACRLNPTYEKIARILLPLSLALLFLLSGVRAALNGYPIGGDHWAYQGLDEIAGYLKTNTPGDAVLYHHWLRWHYTYYLHGTSIELRYWESGEHLLHEACRTPDRAQYIVLPTWRTEDPAIAGVSFEPLLSPQRRDGTVALTLYRVVVDP